MEQVNLSINELIELNQKKIRLLEEMLEATKHQQISISSNSLNSLMDDIKKKQDIMEEVDSVDRLFYAAFSGLKEMLGFEDLGQIDANEYPQVLILKNSVHTIMSLLESIDSHDKQNIGSVRGEIDKVKTQMKDTNNQKKISKSYGTTSPGYSNDIQGYHIDTKK